MLADSSGSSASTSKNAFTHSTANIRCQTLEAQRQHVRVVPQTRVPRNPRLPSQRSPDTRHLVRRDGRPRARPAHRDAKVNFTCGNRLANAPCELRPATLIEYVEVATGGKVLHNCQCALILIVSTKRNAHASCPFWQVHRCHHAPP